MDKQKALLPGRFCGQVSQIYERRPRLFGSRQSPQQVPIKTSTDQILYFHSNRFAGSCQSVRRVRASALPDASVIPRGKFSTRCKKDLF